MKTGPKEKDSDITQNINMRKKGTSKKAEARAKLQEKTAKAEEKRRKAQEKKNKGRGVKEEANMPFESQDDEQSAYKMLQDMRWVYRKVSGRAKLKKLVDKDERNLIFMVRELMKIETSIMAAKIRAKESIGGNMNQPVFVILKGLEDEKRVGIDIGVEEHIAQARQAISILRPDGSDYEGGETDETQGG